MAAMRRAHHRVFALLQPIAVLAASWAWAAPTTAAAAEKTATAADVQVNVVRAKPEWFAAEARVTGYLVPREEAVVNIADGYKVSEVVRGEGDQVNSGQTLARATKLPAELPSPTPDRRPETIDIKAPAAGVIIRASAVVGAVGSRAPTEPLFRIAVDKEIELEAEVGSIHVSMLSPGQPARIEIESPPELSGKVRLVPSAVDPKYQLGRVRVSVDQDPRLRVGMFARATIEANRSRGISVPRSAISYRSEGTGTSVQVVNGSTIETRMVRVGLHNDTNSEIREGLHEGDLVVANAGSSLRDGAKVIPIEFDATRIGER